MTDIAVIGASSFTGKRFCELMTERGHRCEGISFRGDGWFGDLQRLHYKYIVNFAALNVVAPSWELASNYFHVNVTKIAVLAKFLRDQPITKYVHISTPEVYGSCGGKITETMNMRPSTPYALSRATAEDLLRMEFERYGLPVVFTRACNVYGPGQQLYRLIPKVLWHIKKGIPFPLEGGGTSQRAFLYVDDVCDAIEKVMVRGTSGEAYNISSELLKISYVVHECYIACGETRNFEQVPGRQGQDEQYWLDDTKFKRELGDGGPKVSLEEGVARVRDWMDLEWYALKDAPTDYEFRP